MRGDDGYPFPDCWGSTSTGGTPIATPYTSTGSASREVIDSPASAIASDGEPSTSRLQIAPTKNIAIVGPPPGIVRRARMKLITITGDNQWMLGVHLECENN